MFGELLPVNEVFSTFQGEGHFTGTPATFYRLQGCPVGCPWCDTKYTWALDPDNERTVDEILDKRVEDETYALFRPHQLLGNSLSHHVVITGGEPAQYDLRKVTRILLDYWVTAQVETSGTFPLLVDYRTWVTVSPKLNMPGGLKVLPEVLARADEIKHVVGKPSDVDALLSLLADTNPQALIYLQPLSCSAKATALCIRAAADHGWKVSIQRVGRDRSGAWQRALRRLTAST